MVKSDYVSLQCIRVKTHKYPPLLTFRAICYIKLRDPSPVDTFWFIAESILIAHIGTLFESHSRDHVDVSRSRTRLKKLNIDSEVTKRVRKSAPHFCELDTFRDPSDPLDENVDDLTIDA